MPYRTQEEVMREHFTDPKYAAIYMDGLLEDGSGTEITEAFGMIADIHGVGKDSPLTEGMIKRIVEYLAASARPISVTSNKKPARKPTVPKLAKKVAA